MLEPERSEEIQRLLEMDKLKRERALRLQQRYWPVRRKRTLLERLRWRFWVSEITEYSQAFKPKDDD